MWPVCGYTMKPIILQDCKRHIRYVEAMWFPYNSAFASILLGQFTGVIKHKISDLGQWCTQLLLISSEGKVSSSLFNVHLSILTGDTRLTGLYIFWQDQVKDNIFTGRISTKLMLWLDNTLLMQIVAHSSQLLVSTYKTTYFNPDNHGLKTLLWKPESIYTLMCSLSTEIASKSRTYTCNTSKLTIVTSRYCQVPIIWSHWQVTNRSRQPWQKLSVERLVYSPLDKNTFSSSTVEMASWTEKLKHSHHQWHKFWASEGSERASTTTWQREEHATNITLSTSVQRTKDPCVRMSYTRFSLINDRQVSFH
jgi:hypothetical protein